jgi:uncharacterized protein (TIGR00251 family)
VDTDLFDVGKNGAVVLRVHVQPGAGRTAIQGTHGDALKVSVAAPPEAGRANDAVAKLLAETFAVKGDAISIVGGQTSRSKRFEVKGLEEQDVRDRLELALADRRPGKGDRF